MNCIELIFFRNKSCLPFLTPHFELPNCSSLFRIKNNLARVLAPSRHSYLLIPHS